METNCWLARESEVCRISTRKGNLLSILLDKPLHGQNNVLSLLLHIPSSSPPKFATTISPQIKASQKTLLLLYHQSLLSSSAVSLKKSSPPQLCHKIKAMETIEIINPSSLLLNKSYRVIKSKPWNQPWKQPVNPTNYWNHKFLLSSPAVPFNLLPPPPPQI